MNNIGIFGLGCIGSILTKYLNQNLKNHNHYFNRSPRNIIRIQFEDHFTEIPIQLTSDLNVELDWLFICIKEYDYKDAIPWIKKLITSKTKIVIFRNGLDLSFSLRDIVHQDNILETIIDCPTQLHEDGEYFQIRQPKITIPHITLSDKFIKLFEADAFEFIQSENFKLRQWEKLIESSALGSLQVLSNQTCSIFKDQKILNEYRELVSEGIKVAKSEEVEIDPNFIHDLIKKLKSYPDSKGSSMLSDKRSGKKLEINAKIGAIMKIGLKNQIDIPSTQRVLDELLKSN